MCVHFKGILKPFMGQANQKITILCNPGKIYIFIPLADSRKAGVKHFFWFM